MTRQAGKNGFSLMELLLIMTFMLIIAAIAIPKFLTVKQQAAAAAAVSNLHSLNSALAAYQTQFPSIGYPASFSNLGPATVPTSTAADLIDTSLSLSSTVPKQGYTFVYTQGSGSPVNTYSITGSPSINVAFRYFYSDESGVIRFNDTTAASSTSPPIG